MRQLDLISRWFLRASERHPVVGPLALGLFLFGVAQIVLFAFFGGIPRDAFTAVGVEILLLAAGALVPLTLTVIVFREAVGKVLRLAQIATPRTREILLDHLGKTLDGVQDQLNSLESGSGLSLSIGDLDEVEGWMATFFSRARGAYVGFDTSVPSEYLDSWLRFIVYLDGHHPGVRLRVITAPIVEMREDLAHNARAADQLQALHDGWGAQLLYLDGAEVKRMAEDLKLPSSSLINLAFWEGDYCLLWERGARRFSVRLAYAEEDTYARVAQLIDEVERVARPLSDLRNEIDRSPV